ncbi:MAG: 50S ribosomal protein L21 [Planctomycetia bacterium]|nr:50S ribosomal protein L21 [Planctomycetia bacterium]
MYAIIRDGGRQFKVELGTEIQIDYRENLEGGAEFVFDDVLACRTDKELLIGQPTLDVVVKGVVAESLTKGPKLYIQKFRRRKTLRRRTGHRQKYVTIKVTQIGEEKIPETKAEAVPEESK